MWKGPGKSGFGFKNTAEDVTKDVDASGLTAIVTGATSGLGTETARVLALRGAHVFICGRTVDSAETTKQNLQKEIPDAKLSTLAPLELGSQASIRQCVKTFLSLNQPLNLLINNAGVFRAPYGLTEDGIESQFATNHIGHFLLTNLLLDKLKETANKSGIESRIVILSSAGIQFLGKEAITWKDINKKDGYSPFTAYNISKMAVTFFGLELARRLKEEGVTNVTVNCVHPGIVLTNIDRHSKLLFFFFSKLFFAIRKSIPQGAATTCFVALHPSVKGISGQYFADSNEAKITDFIAFGDDVEAAKKLWDISTEMCTKSLPQ